MAAMDFQVSLKALITDAEQRLLLLQEDSLLWDLPGGRMEHGESLCDALQRECQEELGVTVEFRDASPCLAWSVQHSDGIWKVLLCFRVTLDTYALARRWRPSSESVCYRFFRLDELASLPLLQQTQPLLASPQLATLLSTNVQTEVDQKNESSGS